MAGTERSTAGATRSPRAGRGLQLRIGAQVVLPLAVLVTALLLLAAVSVTALARLHTQVGLLDDHLTSIDVAERLSTDLDDVNLAALHLIPTIQPASLDRQEVRLNAQLLPAVRADLVALRAREHDAPSVQRDLDAVSAGLDAFSALLAADAYQEPGSGAQQVAADERLAGRTSALFDPLGDRIDMIVENELQQAAVAKQSSDEVHRVTRSRLLTIVVVSLVAGVLVLLLLIRNVVPRIRRYAHFATEVAGGRPQGLLALSGRDELTELGAALNQMVLSRQQQRELQQEQAEFVETLQVTASEGEAHQLLQRHLQRALPDSDIAVLTRNNSADRLEPATAVDEGSPLEVGLTGAAPRSCLAIRMARTHTADGAGRPALLACQVCSRPEGRTTCEPLIVSGEVIGSVLVGHEQPLAAAESETVRESVFQAAPVLGNLRNLALAEFRANNDFLTGVANKRATEDILKRMVAQANRVLTPLSAIMLDLDHFKQINDRYGHGAGDEALAAVGAALIGTLRASDFVGRFGGEEFLVLLPDTDRQAAAHVAENLRAAVEALTLNGIDRPVTASFGVASLPEDCGDAPGLLRHADRALYRAKAEGRNRVVVAQPAEVVGASVGASASLAPSAEAQAEDAVRR